MRWLLVVGVLGCGSRPADNPSATPIANTPDPVDTAARLGEARALELGSHGTRDYRRAAALYGELCAEGCGDRDACRAFFTLAFRERGTILTAEHAAIPARLCDRGDAVACWVAVMFGVREEAAFTGDLAALCAAGDAKACEADALFDFGEVGHVVARPRPLAACNAGIADGCASVFAGLFPYCSSRNVEHGTPCVEMRAAEWQRDSGDAKPLLDAWAMVQSLCAAGDATACNWVPGKDIDDLIRCKAGDYARCSRYDDHAKAIACAGGLTEHCEPSRPRPSLGVQEAWELRERCTKGDTAACKGAARLTEIPSCPI